MKTIESSFRKEMPPTPPEGLIQMIEEVKQMDENNPELDNGFVQLLRSYPFEIPQLKSEQDSST